MFEVVLELAETCSDANAALISVKHASNSSSFTSSTNSEVLAFRGFGKSWSRSPSLARKFFRLHGLCCSNVPSAKDNYTKYEFISKGVWFLQTKRSLDTTGNTMRTLPWLQNRCFQEGV